MLNKIITLKIINYAHFRPKNESSNLMKFDTVNDWNMQHVLRVLLFFTRRDGVNRAGNLIYSCRTQI